MFPWRREKEKTFRCVKVPILLSSPEVGERAHVALPQANPHVGEPPLQRLITTPVYYMIPKWSYTRTWKSCFHFPTRHCPKSNVSSLAYCSLAWIFWLYEGIKVLFTRHKVHPSSVFFVTIFFGNFQVFLKSVSSTSFSNFWGKNHIYIIEKGKPCFSDNIIYSVGISWHCRK